MSYPCHEDNWAFVRERSKDIMDMASKDPDFGSGSSVLVLFDALEDNRLNPKKDESEWSELNLFKFGLMSFLLPRFIYMMQGRDTGIYDRFIQWGDNNNVPCRFEEGVPYDTWEDLAKQIKPKTKKEYNPEAWKVALLPSQIVTARWVACLEGICSFNYGRYSMYTKIWGVELRPNPENPNDVGWLAENKFRSQTNHRHRHPPIYTAGDQHSYDPTQPFLPDGVTVEDGWEEEFYYYSPPPHQGYRLWSAGPDEHTFPPWISEDEIDKVLSPSDAKQARSWKADDIVHMSN